MAVFLIIAVAFGAASWSARRSDADSDARLLEQRASEAVALFGTTGARIETSLRSLAAVTQATGADPVAFAEFADQEIAGGRFVALAAVVSDGGDLEVVALAADVDVDSVELGDRLAGPREDAVARAAARPHHMTSTGAFVVGDARRLGFAVGSGRSVVYGEAELSGPTPRSTRSYRDLDAVVYASEEVAPDQVVQTTTDDLPLGKGSIQRRLTVGAEQWTLVVKPRSSLTGGLSRQMPTILGLVGLVTAAAAAMTVEALARRRSYALSLVRERTASLRESLLELDSARNELAMHLVSEQATSRQLAQVSQMKSVLLASVSHELRTPMTVVLGLAQVIQDQSDRVSPEELSLLASRVLAQASRLRRLVEDLIDASSIEAGMLSVECAPEDLADVVARAVEPFYSQWNALEVRQMSGTPRVVVDAVRLEQVIVNLLNNAMAACPDGTPIIITTGPAAAGADGAEIRVADRGPGIPVAISQDLFDPFTRVTSGEQVRVGNLGLGLYLAHGLVTAMGGTIEVSSELDVGTTFTIWFPAVADASVAGPSASAGAGAGDLSPA